MKTRSNITPEARALVTQMYLVQSLPPRDILERLRTDLNVTLSNDALRQLIHRLGLPEKRRAAEVTITAALDPAVLAKTRINKATAALDRWQSGAERIADKAIAAAENATGLRDLSLATSTAVQATRLFLLTSGIDGAVRPPSTPVFNFSFAHSPASPFSAEGRARQAAKNVTPGKSAEAA